MYRLECSRICIPLHKHTPSIKPCTLSTPPQHVSQTHLTVGLPLQHSPSPLSHPVVFTLSHITHCTTQDTITHNSNRVSFQMIFFIKPPLHHQYAHTTALLRQSTVGLYRAVPAHLHDRLNTAQEFDKVPLRHGTETHFKTGGHYMHRTLVTICTTSLTFNKIYVLHKQCIYVFCVDLRTNSDYFPVQN